MRKKERLPEVDPVVLPEKIFGMRSGLAILIGLVLVFAILFFLVFMLPGIKNGGVYIGFESGLSDVGVYMDGRYLGSTEGTRYFVKHGGHEFVFFKDGLEISRTTIEIPHPVFFTLLFHRTMDLDIGAVSVAGLEDSIRENFVTKVVDWSKNTQYDGTIYSFPPLFSSFAKDIVALDMEDYSEQLFLAAAHISSQDMLDDYILATGLLEEAGKDIGFDDSFLSGLGFSGESVISQHVERDPVEPEGFSEGWIDYAGGSLTMGSYDGSTYPLTNEAEMDVTVPAFSIMRYPVSEYEYALFIEENPYWAKSNIENIVADGMADENYLSSIILSTSFRSTRPIRNISYHAAKAYAGWLSEKTGKNLVLPSEAVWTYAAVSAEDAGYASSLAITQSDPSVPAMMFGGLWEMTGSSYIPLSRLTDYQTLQELSGNLDEDIIVKGGSYLSSSSLVTADTVGIMSKEATSPYAGFRLVEMK